MQDIFMGKFFFKYTFIILGNLLAFLLVGNILDALFDTKPTFIYVFLVLSVVSLVIISSFYIKSTLNELSSIKSNKSNGRKHK